MGSARRVEKNKDVPIDTATWSVAPLFFRDIYKGNVKKLEDWKDRKKKEREAAKKKKTTTKSKDKEKDKDNNASALSTISNAPEVSPDKGEQAPEAKPEGESAADGSEM